MRLLELPSEILLLIFESLGDARALHDLTQTCLFAQDIYTGNSLSILESVTVNAYAGFAATALDTVDAIRSLGALDYVYLRDHHVEWIVPESCRLSRRHALSENNSLSVLQTLTNLINDTEGLADWCTSKCQQRSAWSRDKDIPLRQSVVETLLQLQLATNRLYNVRLPSFPEHVSLREHERERLDSCISRKTRDQALDLMADQLRPLDLHRLRNLWILMQILQDEYLLLRRHRLRPALGSLLDLLFQHDSDEHGWRISPWFTVQGLLSKLGVHVVPARPGTVFRFLGHEAAHELQQRDVTEFDEYVASRSGMSSWGGGGASGTACTICLARSGRGCSGECLHDYLERFRPLLGLSYPDATPTKYLVRFVGSMQPIIIANVYRAYDGTTDLDQSALGKLLWECAEHNRPIAAAKRRNSSRVEK